MNVQSNEKHGSGNSADGSYCHVHVCGDPLDGKEHKSELFRGYVCKECHKIEQNNWRRFGVGTVIICLSWLVVRVLYRRGTVRPLVGGIFSLWWGLIWFGICLLMTYRSLNNKKKKQKSQQYLTAP